MDTDIIMRIVVIVAIMFLVVPGFLRMSRRYSFSELTRQAGLWILIGMGAAILYYVIYGGQG